MTDLAYDVVLCVLAFAAGHWFGRTRERDRLAPFVAYAVKDILEKHGCIETDGDGK